MTLSKQFAYLIVLIVTMLFLGSATISLYHTRSFFIEQLENSAQDTATSLGLSLSTIKNKDKTIMLSMVNATFDRAMFERISIVSEEGDVIVEKKLPSSSSLIPFWFEQIIDLPRIKKEAKIMDGWKQSGAVSVESNLDVAYQNLWNVEKYLFIWNLTIAILTCIIGIITIRILFSPLQKIVKQARAISEQQFVVTTEIPKTKELRHVTLAINQMVEKVKIAYAEHINLIDKLNADIYKDALLGIANRKFFLQSLNNVLTNEEAFQPGYVVLIEIKDINAFNKRHGFIEGDKLIQQINQKLLQNLNIDECMLYGRIGGAIFAAIIFLDEAKLSCLLEQILSDLLKVLKPIDSGLVLHIGGGMYDETMSVSETMSLADNALQLAQAQSVNGFHLIKSAQKHQMQPASHWLPLLERAIHENQLVLYTQNVVDKANKVIQQEVFIKLKEDSKQLLAANLFMPMVEKMSFGLEVDKYVIEQVCHLLQGNQAPVALNLSGTTILSLENHDVIIKLLSEIPKKYRKQLQFEFSETLVLRDLKKATQLMHALKRLGCEIGIDRVGMNFSALLAHLHELPIRYVKIDGSYSKYFETDKDKQIFIQHLQAATSTIGINLIATHIESKEQWQVMQQASMVFGQGNYLAPIQAVKI